jgi:hypothetical protein
LIKGARNYIVMEDLELSQIYILLLYPLPIIKVTKFIPPEQQYITSSSLLMVKRVVISSNCAQNELRTTVYVPRYS